MPTAAGPNRSLSFFLIAAVVFTTASSLSALPIASLGKQHRTIQSDPTTLTGDSTSGGAWHFAAQTDASATGAKSFTAPGAAPVALGSVNSTTGASYFSQGFSSQSALLAAYPAGTYTLSFNGSTVPVSLPTDALPSQPLANTSNGTWSLGNLYAPAGQALTISYLFGSNYTSGHAKMVASVTGAGYSDTETTPDFVHSQWSITIPASAMVAGAAFQVTLDSDNLVTQDTTSVPGWVVSSFFEGETSFVVQVGTAPASGQPRFTAQPSNLTVATGSTFTLSVAATGTPAPTYQWMQDKNVIAGATGPRLVVTGATAASAGNYVCVATNSVATSNSAGAVITIVSTANPGRLVNLSVLTAVQGLLTTGFVTGGSGTSGNETLLLRGIGPALTAFGLSGLLPDPTIALIPSGATSSIATNSGWGSPSTNVSAVNLADAATGAFALSNTASLDSAMVQLLGSGGYSVQIQGKSGDSGTALTEVYDDTANYTPASTRLINVSCLTPVAANGTLTSGFSLGGTTAKTVLIRATGPALSALGVASTMPDPQIAVYASGATSPMIQNAGWKGDAQIATAAASVGAFPLNNPASADSAVVLTLMPGGYSAQVSSVSGKAGTTLVEVYEVP